MTTDLFPMTAMLGTILETESFEAVGIAQIRPTEESLFSPGEYEGRTVLRNCHTHFAIWGAIELPAHNATRAYWQASRWTIAKEMRAKPPTFPGYHAMDTTDPVLESPIEGSYSWTHPVSARGTWIENFLAADESAEFLDAFQYAPPSSYSMMETESPRVHLAYHRKCARPTQACHGTGFGNAKWVRPWMEDEDPTFWKTPFLWISGFRGFETVSDVSEEGLTGWKDYRTQYQIASHVVSSQTPQAGLVSIVSAEEQPSAKVVEYQYGPTPAPESEQTFNREAEDASKRVAWAFDATGSGAGGVEDAKWLARQALNQNLPLSFYRDALQRGAFKHKLGYFPLPMFRVPPESAADFGHHAECSVLNLFAADDFVALGLEAPATGDYKLGCKISLPRISLEAHTTSAFEIPGLLSARNPLGLTVSESTITYPGGGSVTFKQLAFFKLGGPGVTFSPENNAQIFAPIGFSPDQVRRLVPDILAATFGFQVRTTFHGVDEYGNPYQTIGAWIIQVSGLFERSPEAGYQFTEKLRIPLIGTFEGIEPEYDPMLEAGYVAQVKEKLDALLLATPEVVGALKLKGFHEGDPDLGSTGLCGLPALTPQFNVTATPFPTNPATVG